MSNINNFSLVSPKKPKKKIKINSKNWIKKFEWVYFLKNNKIFYH